MEAPMNSIKACYSFLSTNHIRYGKKYLKGNEKVKCRNLILLFLEIIININQHSYLLLIFIILKRLLLTYKLY